MWISTRYAVPMATNRAADRHRSTGYLYRPTPPDLLQRLDAAVGPRRRPEMLSALLAAYLDGGPMPARPWLDSESGDSGQDHEE